jgi:hypothetical protein
VDRGPQGRRDRRALIATIVVADRIGPALQLQVFWVANAGKWKMKLGRRSS